MQVIKKCFLGASLWAFFFVSNVFAQGAGSGRLPQMEEPSRGAGSGLRETAQNHLYDGGILIGLVIATLAFIAVAWHAIKVFSEVQDAKKKWGDFIAVVVVGVVMLIAVIWLLTKAAEIL